MASDLLALDYFAGGVPAGATLSLQLSELGKLTQQQAKIHRGQHLVLELAFIGVFSYFDAFCKDHFASIINILPQLVQELRKRGHDTRIDATDLPALGEHITARVGFLLAEGYDFGTPRKVNALYHALIEVTPFSSKELNRFEKLLADRNLIVHHGGIYTMKYVKQNFSPPHTKDDHFFNSLVIDIALFELYPAEQARILRLLIERIDVAADGISVTLHAAGIRSLVAELASEQATAPDPSYTAMMEASE